MLPAPELLSLPTRVFGSRERFMIVLVIAPESCERLSQNSGGLYRTGGLFTAEKYYLAGVKAWRG